MKKKVLALSFILLLSTICLTSTSFTQAAGEGQWITGYTIEDAQTNQLLMEYNSTTGVNETIAPVIPGANIIVTFTVNVFTAGDGNLKLQTALQRSESGKFWELITEDYDMGSAYNPNSQSTSFNWVEGEFTMMLYGKVPLSASDTPKPVNVVSLFGPTSGTPIDKISIIPTTADMDRFQTLLTEKQDALQSLKDSGVDQGFIDMYENVLSGSQAVAEGGDIDNAIALLNGLDVAAPPSSTMQMLFLPIVGVTAALAVVFLVMFLRARGKVSYFQLVVEDQIKDLEGLTLRAAKIDRTMSSSLESVKDRLKRLVGM